MNGFTENNPFFQQALTEHRALHRLLHELEETLAAGPQERTPRRRRKLAVQLERLRTHMAEHFAREEAGGCLEEALSRVPRLGPQVDELEEQHAPLLAQLDAVLAQVSRARQESTTGRIGQGDSSALPKHCESTRPLKMKLCKRPATEIWT